MIKAEMTHYNESDMTAVFKYYYAPLLVKMAVIYAIISAALFGSEVFLVLNGSADKIRTIFEYISLGSALLAFICSITGMSNFSANMLKRYYVTYREGNIYFEFDCDSYSINSVYRNQTDSISGKYTELLKAVESNDHFLMFVNKKTIHVVRKDSFTEGTPDELRDILQKSIGKKYLIKMKKAVTGEPKW